MISKFKTYIVTFLMGIIMGIANIIPGVSGGTIAVGLGIFDKLIEAINNIFKKPKKYLPFLIPLGLGMAFGILAFSGVISFGLTNYSFITNMFFVGLVVSSIPLILKSSKERNYKPSYKIFALIGFSIVLLFAILERTGFSGTNSSASFIKLFISGAIASSAMVIPGISGSFMMILLGVYDILLNALSLLKDWMLNPSDTAILIESLKVIVPLGIGIVLGVLFIGKVIEYLFAKFSSQTYFVILGLIFGSMVAIFINPETYSTGSDSVGIIIGIVLGVVGFLIGSLFVKKDSK